MTSSNDMLIGEWFTFCSFFKTVQCFWISFVLPSSLVDLFYRFLVHSSLLFTLSSADICRVFLFTVFFLSIFFPNFFPIKILSGFETKSHLSMGLVKHSLSHFRLYLGVKGVFEILGFFRGGVVTTLKSLI